MKQFSILVCGAAFGFSIRRFKRKKAFCLAVGALFFALYSFVSAQQSNRIPRIGYLSAVDRATDLPRAEGIRRALRDLGYVEGQNIAFEYRHTQGTRSNQSEHAIELVRLKVDLIVVSGGIR